MKSFNHRFKVLPKLFDHPRIKRLVLALFIAYGIAFIISTAQTFITNHRNGDGVILQNQTVLGGDFIAFYLAGKTVLNNYNDLYDFKHFVELEQKFIEGRDVKLGYLPFAYPPLVALMFSALSSLSFQQAYFTWFAVSFGLFLLSFLIASKTLKFTLPETIFFLFASLAFEPFLMEALGAGQTSCIGLFIFTCIFALLKSKRETLAGMMLGLFYYKPPLALFFVLSSLVQKRFKLMLGFTITSVFLLLGTILFCGLDGFLTYIKAASQYTYGVELLPTIKLPAEKGVGLFAALVLILKQNMIFARTAYALIFMLCLFIVSRLSILSDSIKENKAQSLTLLFALEVSLSLLLSPQMIIYDLSILLLPIWIVFKHIKNKPTSPIILLITLTTLGLYLEWLSRVDACSCFVIKPVMLLFVIWNVCLLKIIRDSVKFC